MSAACFAELHKHVDRTVNSFPTHAQVIEQIAAIRDLHSKMVPICTRGSCMRFHLVLRKLYPVAECWFNIDHVITKIGGRFYDITGQVNPAVINLLLSSMAKGVLAEHSLR